jgi:glycosyltransferase involved in cell wall biosynthesis
MPEISVILPTRKRNHLLPRALNSVLAQTFDDFEILVVDDNPPESRILQQESLKILLQHPKVRVIENLKQKNAAAARNCALRVATGKWITYLDDDDVYRPTKLERQGKQAQETGLLLGLCGSAFHLQKRIREIQTVKNKFSGAELLLEADARTEVIFHLNTGKIFFDENLSAGEDVYFFFELMRHFGVKEVFNVPEPLVDIYPQADERVNLNAEALWQASLAIHRDFGLLFGGQAAQVYLLRARLQRCKFQRGEWMEMVKLALALMRLRGTKDLRAMANAFLFKVPALRKYLVS